MWPTEVRDEPSGLLGRSRQKARPHSPQQTYPGTGLHRDLHDAVEQEVPHLMHFYRTSIDLFSIVEGVGRWHLVFENDGFVVIDRIRRDGA